MDIYCDAEFPLNWSERSKPSSDVPANAILVRGLTENGGAPVYHRHFGGIARLSNGRILVMYRRASGHVVSFPGEICALFVEPDYASRSDEFVVVEHTDGIDHRDPNLCVTPTGRIVCTYTDADSAGGTLAELKAIYSDDGGSTWSAPVTFSSKFDARMYGAIKCVKHAAGCRLISSAYYFDTDDGTKKRVGYFYSDDDGLSWVEGTPVWTGTDASELSEMEIAWLSADIGFAAIRNSGVGLHWSVTADGGDNWSAPVRASWSRPADVAPSLDVIWSKGEPHLLLGYCDRQADQTIWRWAKATSLSTSADPMEANAAVASPSDMVGASGYQRTVMYPDGNMLFVEFKEYESVGGISAQMGTDVRLVLANPGGWISGT